MEDLKRTENDLRQKYRFLIFAFSLNNKYI